MAMMICKSQEYPSDRLIPHFIRFYQFIEDLAKNLEYYENMGSMAVMDEATISGAVKEFERELDTITRNCRKTIMENRECS